MNKIIKAYNTQLSYDISDVKKSKAEKAILYFNNAVKLLDLAKNHLNIIKNPFEENPEMSPEDVMKTRSALRRFRDKSIDNFNNFKKASFNCVNIMQEFSSDTQTVKVMKSFISSIDDLENKVNEFADLFQNLENKEFVKNIVEVISNIQRQSEEVEEIIDERIKSHIQDNILAKNWVDNVSNDLQIQIEKSTPLILELFNDREKALNKAINDQTNNKNE